MFGVETVLWPTTAKKSGKWWYRGVVEAAECFMARRHSNEAESGWLRYAAEDAKSDDKGRGGGGGRGSRTDTTAAVDECRTQNRSCRKVPVRIVCGT